MPDNTTLIEISAFSGLAGAILTQALTGLFAYVNDKRKSGIELRSQYRNKQIEIADNYYYVTGETMSVLRKSVELWRGRNLNRSEAVLKSMKDRLIEADGQLKKMTAENWKHNLIGLYFDVSLADSELIAANNKSHELYLAVVDIENKIGNTTDDQEKESIYMEYSFAVFNLCGQYEAVYTLLKTDMDKVKSELLGSFKSAG